MLIGLHDKVNPNMEEEALGMMGGCSRE